MNQFGCAMEPRYLISDLAIAVMIYLYMVKT